LNDAGLERRRPAETAGLRFTFALRNSYRSLTAYGESPIMRRLAAILAALSLLATAGIAGAGGVPPFPHLAGAWSHAEINIKIKREPHTLILDRGRIRSLSNTQLTLRETDATPAVITISPRTIVTIKHVKHATIFMLRRGMNVETMSIDGGAALRVRVTS
jgi:hypothetical protein